MANLVQIPWQPQMWLTPDTLALLVAAGNRLGVRLQVNSPDGAWRSYARQKALWDAYQRYLRGGAFANVASNPDNGQRNHMRGAAFDLLRTDAAAQAACRAVGLIRDGAESWHWNNPRWTSMPIILTNTSTAGGGGIPIGDDMSAAEVQELKNYINGTAASIIAQFQGVNGYENPNSIVELQNLIGSSRDTIRNDIDYQNKLNLAQYDHIIATIKAEVAKIPTSGGTGGGTVDLSAVLAKLDEIKASVAAIDVPTAAENGAAARLAIVK